jgi:hypothetical protein
MEIRDDTLTPTNVQVEINPSEKVGFLSTKKGKIILFSIIGVIIIAAIIGIVIATKKKPCKGEECEHPPECKGEGCIPPPYPKPNEVLIYDDVQNKKTNVEFGLNGGSSRRRLEENNKYSQETKMTSKYMINVYKEENEVYYGYAIVMNMDKTIGKRDTERLGGVDVTKESNVNNDVPAARFTFNNNGKILSFEVSKEINETLAAYLYELVQKVFPDVSNKSRKLEGKENEYEFTDNKDDGTWTTNIKDGIVTNIEENSKSSLYSDSEQIDLNINNNNFTEEVQNDENAVRKSLINEIITEVNSKVTLQITKLMKKQLNLLNLN